MIKKFKSNSDIAINVRIDDKTSKHIKFDVNKTGGSVYITDDEKVQEAIENHSRFNELFYLYETIEEDVSDNEDGNDASHDNDDDHTSNKTIIEVGSIQEAKDYLESNGANVKELKSKAKIISYAATQNIEFKGI